MISVLKFGFLLILESEVDGEGRSHLHCPINGQLGSCLVVEEEKDVIVQVHSCAGELDPIRLIELLKG